MAEEVRDRCYSRVGLLGNPSDGYAGKVISFALKNFFCEVTMKASKGIQFVPHFQHDGYHHASLEALSSAVESQGYTGGLHLLLVLLFAWIARKDWPALALAVETELGITAGLQDRVIQTFGGLQYMDFDEQFMLQHGQGRYEPLDYSKLPALYIIYSQHPSHSGKIHGSVKERWLKGEAAVREGMQAIASLAEQGRTALQHQDWHKLRQLMDENFELRQQIFGTDAIGAANIFMVNLVRANGGSAKLTGSGGAVVALFPPGSEDGILEAAGTFESKGFKMVRAEIASFAEADKS